MPDDWEAYLFLIPALLGLLWVFKLFMSVVFFGEGSACLSSLC